MMKLVNLFLIASLLFAVSCNSGSDKSDDDDDSKEEKSTTESSVFGGDNENLSNDASFLECEEFIDDYETWVDEVIKVYKKVETDPMNVENSQKLMEVNEQMVSWSQKWYKLYDCVNNPAFAARMEELELRMEEAFE